MSMNLLRWAIALSISANIAGRPHGAGTITFSTPARVFPLGNTTARTYGGLYADAFYSVAVGGDETPGAGTLFGTPGVTGSGTTVQLSTDGGRHWTPWYPGHYVSPITGYPFTAVHNGTTGMHDLGSACSSDKGVPQTVFHNNGTVDTWMVSREGDAPTRKTVPLAVSFHSLPVPLTCTTGGVGADCFWLHAGGTVSLPEAVGGGLLMTNCVPWLGGRFGATKEGAGVFAWHSTDGAQWTFRGTVATATQFPSSGEGPNENDVSLLADGRTLLAVFRIDDGVDGGKVTPKNYRAATSVDGGKSWSEPVEMKDKDGRGMGVARPRLLLLSPTGPLLLSGGRLYTEQTRDILLWVSWDGMGTAWQAYSISYHHNLGVQPADLRFSAAVNATTGRATTSYTSMLPLGGGQAAVVYNGETGIFAMTLKVATK